MIQRLLLALALALGLGLTAPAFAADQNPLKSVNAHPTTFGTGDTVGVAHGGTGAVSLTAHCVLVGAGTSAAHLVCPTMSGYVLTDNGSGADPSFQAVSGGSGTVTTTGSPASGNLTKFSGASSITSGDLSGDVTTSGTLATTIANSAVTLAKIANASAGSKLLGSGASGSGAPYAEITVGTGLTMTGTTLSASGGGGGYTAAPYWTAQPTAPVSSSFTLVQGTSVSASMTNTTRGVLFSNTGAVADRNALMEQTTPGSTWTMTALVTHSINWRKYISFGLYVKDHTTGKIEAFLISGDNAATGSFPVADIKWTDINTYSGQTQYAYLPHYYQFIWLKLVLDATNLTFSYSTDGESYTRVVVVAKNNFVGTIDRAGVYFNANDQTLAATETIHLMSFSLL